jgi:hypothetical protein
VNKRDLAAIAAAPFANNEVQSQANAFGSWQRAVQRLRLQSRGVTTCRRERLQSGLQASQGFGQKIHFKLTVNELPSA